LGFLFILKRGSYYIFNLPHPTGLQLRLCIGLKFLYLPTFRTGAIGYQTRLMVGVTRLIAAGALVIVETGFGLGI